MQKNIEQLEDSQMPPYFSKGPFLKATLLQALKVWGKLTWKTYWFVILITLFVGIGLAGFFSAFPDAQSFLQFDSQSNFIPKEIVIMILVVSVIHFFATKWALESLVLAPFSSFRVVFQFKEGRTLTSASLLFYFFFVCSVFFFFCLYLQLRLSVFDFFPLVFGPPPQNSLDFLNPDLLEIFFLVVGFLTMYFFLNYKHSILKIVPLENENPS